jgi:hypothetical protein
MGSQHDDLKSVDPKLPHAFVEKANVPFAVPRAPAALIGPELPFRRSDAAEGCALCGRSRDDRIHEASDQAAEAEEWHWPV